MQDYKKRNIINFDLKSGLNGSTILTELREIVKIRVQYNFPKVLFTFGKFLQVKHGTFKFTKNKTISRLARLIVLFLVFWVGFKNKIFAHPSPNSAVLLNVHSNRIDVELQLPISELQLIFGQDFIGKPEEIIPKYNKQLKEYILQHFHPKSLDNRAWSVILKDFSIQPSQQLDDKFYQDLSVHLQIIPPVGANIRTFNLNYDVIVHQVITHAIIVSIKQDWESGINVEEPTQIGVMSWDVVNNILPIFKVNLEDGSIWKGFKSMVNLGVQHIAEGTDHLLFLLVLLLPIPLIVSNKKWGNHRDVKTSIIHITMVVTAFTIGHSLTLLFGALGWLILPTQWIEILIGVSILISAIHAFRPLFPNKETYIALSFGLIHGLAFANTLTNLQLETGRIVLSILGFNIGIELMQLLVISVTIPWLILLSRTSFYTFFRTFGAIIGFVAACGWILERTINKGNYVTILIGKLTTHSLWLLLGLIVLAVFGYFMDKRIRVSKN
jgi:HupE / UreJ protein